MRCVQAIVSGLVFFFAGSLTTSQAFAQEHHHADQTGTGWSWFLDGQAFLNANFQVRKFTDFYRVESQNWMMLEGSRAAGKGRLHLHGMFSLEPLTLRRIGSAQAFQTGETFEGAPLIDYQHPHDLFMGLEARYEREVSSGTRFWISGAPVGAAALGPAAFMHRASGELNPTAPLSHHELDSSHISRSVISVGVSRRSVSFEASTFKGREPDENRWDLDLGVPDSWSARVGWTRGSWTAQVSGGRLTTPEAVDPFRDMTRLTASVAYSGSIAGRPLAVTAALGRNLEFGGKADGGLIEATWRSGAHVLYGRAELADKEILTAGAEHPPGFVHELVLSTVGAFTAGYAYDVHQSRSGAISLGGDVTTHDVPKNLVDSYGRHPYSMHLYLRWRLR